MEALILACSTGGGHGTAALAVAEELERRGHSATVMDAYTLVSERLAQRIGNGYVVLARKAPHLFGVLYKMGEGFHFLPFHAKNPVYWANSKMVPAVRKYLDSHSYDIIIMTHFFPGQTLAALAKTGYPLPPRILVATDYAIIPCTEDTDSDYYNMSSRDVEKDFLARKIPEENLLAYGIPVRRQFLEKPSRQEAMDRLGLDPEEHYMLLMGGSIGAGKMKKTAKIIQNYLKSHPDWNVIVICGNYEKLYQWFESHCGKNPQVILLRHADPIADYMAVSDIMLSKPGGLSSTEAAVFGIPLIHIAPIPGLEQHNRAFFVAHGMSLRANSRKQLLAALERLQDPKECEKMLQAQAACVNPNAASDLCDFAEKLVEKGA